ncbi:hypothetical protein RM844_11080 [Streptomyces sp. DSM 44915]|uniref:Class F sortase n=1 Tax=Streptomyces chisholmiae TaxID=3075540 RepID=A0ABU2JPB8_9ACTN|nr:hypothetical protein [Streptomyces sp. DSM 44915]MDT0266834.1 hypothetical protein [Streptomyces sp. DSM 44915]
MTGTTSWRRMACGVAAAVLLVVLGVTVRDEGAGEPPAPSVGPAAPARAD